MNTPKTLSLVNKPKLVINRPAGLLRDKSKKVFLFLAFCNGAMQFAQSQQKKDTTITGR
jgi:hypothetical protein